MEKLSVFVLHWNSPYSLLNTVDSIQSSEGIQISLTVLDNGSDPDKGHAHLLDEAVQVVRLNRNLGYAGGMNYSLNMWLMHQGEDVCLVCAHDVTVERETVLHLYRAAQTHPEYGILAPVVEYQGEKPVLSFGGSWGRFLGARDRQFPRTWHPPGAVLEADWVCGACLLLRRSCLEDAGLFDPELFAYYEDVDLGLRAQRSGWKVGVVTGTRIRLGATAASPNQAAYLGARNQLLVARRHGGLLALVLATARVAARLVRPGLGSFLPFRSSAQRTASKSFGRALTRGTLDYFAGRMGRGSFTRLKPGSSAPKR